MTFKIYTKTGDRGETGLFGGGRVQKDDLRVEVYGTVDELNAALGQARVHAPHEIDERLARVQHLLFELGAEFASPGSKPRLRESDVLALEHDIDAMEHELPPLKHFILPAGTESACALHLCRAICRRAERHLVGLMRRESQDFALALVFLNRLSDYLFVLARFANHLQKHADLCWQARD